MRLEDFFNRLFTVRNSSEFKAAVNDLLSSGYFDTGNLLSQYCRYSPVFSNIQFVISRLSSYADIRQSFRALSDIGYIKNPVVSSSALKSMAAAFNPLFAWRLYFIFCSTSDTQKKLMIVESFIRSGVTVFAKKMLRSVEKDLHEVQIRVLQYFSEIPEMTSGDIKLLFQKVDDILKKADTPQKKRNIYNVLSVINQRQAFPRRALRVFLRDGSAQPHFLFNMLNCRMLPKHPVYSKDRIASILESQNVIEIKLLTYDSESIKRTAELLKDALSGKTEYPLQRLQILLRVMVRFNHSLIFDELLTALSGPTKFTIKRLILDVLIFFTPGEVQKENLRAVCVTLLNDKTHVRIFESLARVFILFYQNEGLSKIYDHFAAEHDYERLVMILAGISSALMEYGYGLKMNSKDMYVLTMIILNTAEQLRTDTRLHAGLFLRLCRLLLHLSADVSRHDILELIQRYPINADSLKILTRIHTKEAKVLLHHLLKTWRNEVSKYAYFIHIIFYELANSEQSNELDLHSDLCQSYITHPLFTADVIYYFARKSLTVHAAQAATFCRIDQMHLQYYLLLLLAQTDTRRFMINYFRLFSRGSEEIQMMAASRLLISENPEIVKKLYRIFIVRKANPQRLLETVKSLPRDFTIIQTNFLALSAQRNVDGFAAYAETAAYLAVALFYLSPDSDTRDEKKETIRKEDPVMLSGIPYMPESALMFFRKAEQSYHFFIETGRHSAKDISPLINEYRAGIEIIIRSLIIPRMDQLVQNNEFIHALTHIFKTAQIFLDFFAREKMWLEITFQPEILQVIIGLCLKRDAGQLTNYLADLERVYHLLAMVLCNNEFFQIKNPMNLPLDLFRELRILEHLFYIHSTAEEFLSSIDFSYEKSSSAAAHAREAAIASVKLITAAGAAK